MQSSAAQQATRLQRLLMTWKELNEKTQRVEEKLNQPLFSEMKELIINQSISEKVLDKQLMEHKVLCIFLYNIIIHVLLYYISGIISRTNRMSQ